MYLDFSNVLIFFLFGVAFVILNVSVLSRILRPIVRGDEAKDDTYECGEPTVGSAWVRFDMRFYTVALIFIVFEVEVVFLFPWAVVFKQLQAAGPFIFVEMFIFLAILVVGFAYVWVKGDLDWVKAAAAQIRSGPRRSTSWIPNLSAEPGPSSSGSEKEPAVPGESVKGGA